LWVLQVLQAIQVLQAPGYGRLCDFQMVLKLSVAANTSVQGVLQVLQAIQVLQAMGFPDQAMGLSDDIEMESNRRVRDPCDPGSVSDLIAFLPDNAERVVTSTSSTASSPLDRIGWCTHEVIAP
jgi:hypothetical protein